jgi:hypothetical protein
MLATKEIIRAAAANIQYPANQKIIQQLLQPAQFICMFDVYCTKYYDAIRGCANPYRHFGGDSYSYPGVSQHRIA